MPPKDASKMTDDGNERFNLLLVDDEKKILTSLKRILFDEPFHLYMTQSGQEALSIMKETDIHAALIDLMMPEMDGFSLLRQIKNEYPHIMVMIVTGHGTIRDAVDAIQMGAEDFIEKPFTSERIVNRIHQLRKMWRLDRENRQLKEKMASLFRYDDFIGTSPATLHLKQMISRVGPCNETVLIQGETGTGKEVVAKAIHHHSQRASQPFVIVDCTTIHETMLESELFGHLKGAFTGAHTTGKGLVATADRGTLFLDEIGELPLRIQAKLLRLIQDKEIRPVGADRSTPVDVRIMAATNRNLEQEIKKKSFREDLYYRLTPLPLTVPPLRDRKADLPLLSRHFIQKYQTDFSIPEAISPHAFKVMEAYDWPGNVRELENVIRRILALSPHKVIQPEDLPEPIFHSVPSQIPNQGDTLEAYERVAIINALKKSENHRKNAAQILGIGEATLYRKIRKLWPSESKVIF